MLIVCIHFIIDDLEAASRAHFEASLYDVVWALVAARDIRQSCHRLCIYH